MSALQALGRTLNVIILALALAAPAAAEDFPLATGESGPSVTSAELGLEKIRTAAALVYHTPDSVPLARQVAAVLEKTHRSVHALLGIPVKVHGVVLYSDPRRLPPRARGAYWLHIDGASCLVRQADGADLASAPDDFHRLLFFMLAHEASDPGIKAALFSDRLTQDSASSRWWIEGLSDYAAAQAARRLDRRALAEVKKTYREQLDRLAVATLDLESGATWWPKGSRGPDDIQYSYAAAHYAIAALCAKHGQGWIAQTLARLRREGKGQKTTSADFCRVAGSLTGEDVGALVRTVRLDAVRAFVDSL